MSSLKLTQFTQILCIKKIKATNIFTVGHTRSSYVKEKVINKENKFG